MVSQQYHPTTHFYNALKSISQLSSCKCHRTASIWDYDFSQGGGAMNNENRNNVVVVDIKMPFMSMVVFMVKWAIASIPAIIILFVIGIVLGGFFGRSY